MLLQSFYNFNPLLALNKGSFMTLLPLVLLVLVFYFLLIKPQKKREKTVQNMRGNLKVGDKVITIGGIHGEIIKINDDKLTLETSPDKAKVEVTRWAISVVTADDVAKQ